VVAIGEVQPGACEALGLEAGPSGIQIDRHSHQTAVAGVFAGGDAVRAVAPHMPAQDAAAPAGHGRQRLAVRSVGDGAAIAASVDQFLRGLGVTGPHHPFTCHVGHLKEGEIDKFMAGASPAPGQELSGSACDFTDAQARDESARCLRCDCRKSDNCRLRDACDAYGVSVTRFKGERRTFEQDLSHPAIIYESGKCIACGLCIQIASQAKERLGLTFIGRGFNVRVRVPFDESLSAGLRTVADACVQACPTGALAHR
jgi:ferredoxin